MHHHLKGPNHLQHEDRSSLENIVGSYCHENENCEICGQLGNLLNILLSKNGVVHLLGDFGRDDHILSRVESVLMNAFDH